MRRVQWSQHLGSPPKAGADDETWQDRSWYAVLERCPDGGRYPKLVFPDRAVTCYGPRLAEAGAKRWVRAQLVREFGEGGWA